ncbi:NitT/TauT family transport system permease protein [Beijerinckia sp. 28-YEA-48]|nr:NitT/TauT family transport system permease protein [Beijerinckia sp. 28-YEA-48]
MNMTGSSRLWNWRATVERTVFFALLALLWEYAVTLFQIKSYLLPPLSRVLESLWANKIILLQHSLVTTWEIVLGYIAAVFGGLALGLAIFAWPMGQRLLYPLVVLFQGLPKVALAPLMVVWIGYGTSSKVLMAFLFAFFPVVIATLGGLAGTPAHLIEHFKSIGASRLTTFRRLEMPAALPAIMDGCKTAMPLAVIGAIVGEFVGAQHGLGYLILEANAAARTDLLFAALVAISILATLLYWLVEIAANRVWWRALT